MSLKENIAAANFLAIKKGLIKPSSAFGLFGKCDFILSRKLSSAGKYLRRSQLKQMIQGLTPSERRAWISVFFPTELLYPFGIIPLSLEILSGLFSTVGLSEEFLEIASSAGVPSTMCSFHRLLYGLCASGHFAHPDIVAATSLFCDGNLKSFSEAARENGRDFFFVDVPFEYNSTSIKYLKEQLEAMTRRLAEKFGVSYSPELIVSSVAKADVALKKLKRIYELRRARFTNAFRGFEMISFCFPSHYLLGSELLSDIADKIIESVSSGKDRHRYYRLASLSPKAKRLMWMHIVPQYDTKIWDLIDNGINSRIVCEEYTAPYFEGYDLRDPFGSIARRLILHPSNGPLQRRIDNAVRIARDFDVDGVIHYSSWGCHQAAGNVSIVEREFERQGIKFLNLNGDAIDRKNTTFGQHKTRIEAFLER